jgi:hypothetical protein
MLKTLVRQRHWKYSTFCAEYARVAGELDPQLVGSRPSRAQFQRWLTGDLKRLPYPDACRVLEGMFPGWSVEALFESTSGEPPVQRDERLGATMRLVTSGAELRNALVEVVRGARECLVATGSRSCEPAYLQEIEHCLRNRPGLVHYRILIGCPHNGLVKDHLLRLLDITDLSTSKCERRVHISIITDLVRDHERFFVASESSALVVLPSVNSPRNFDTGLLIGDPQYAQALVQHGKGLYGSRRLESVEAVEALQVLE